MKFREFVKISFAAAALIFCLALQSKADDSVLVSQNGSAYFETDKYQISIVLVDDHDINFVFNQFDISPNQLKQIVRTKFTNTLKLNELLYIFITLTPLKSQPDARLSYAMRLQGNAQDMTKPVKRVFLRGNLIKGRMYRINKKTIPAIGADEISDIGIAKIFIDIFDGKKKIKSVEMRVNVVE
ncbi:MAG: hypothetical protein LBC07_04325 [Elusimicrobiota bacterium]|jgi:hypothetical protein|nr:hypothetical protein [Elusimicrobiota bacterium]